MSIFNENYDISNAGIDPKGSFLASKLSLVDRGTNSLAQALNVSIKKERLSITKCDAFAQVASEYGSLETPGISKCLEILSNCIYEIQNQRKRHLQDLEYYCLPPLQNTQKATRFAREKLKDRVSAFSTRDQKRKNMEKLSGKSTNPSRMSMAKIELEEAVKIVDSEEDTLARHMEEFERNKIGNIKDACATLILSEMNLHAKALEFLTEAYTEIEGTNEELDLAVSYRSNLRDSRQDIP